MAISVADNFSYQGGKPLDARMKFSSVSDMVATPAASLYDGCFAYVTAEKKYYSYDSSNTEDPTLGKWTEYSSGGGGSTYTAGDGIEIDENNEISTDNMPSEDMSEVVSPLPGVMARSIYNSRFNRSDMYDTDEVLIGKWIDGKPLYQKTVSCGALPNNADKEVDSGLTNVNVVGIRGISFDGTNNLEMPYPSLTAGATIGLWYINSTNKVKIRTAQDYTAYTNTYVTIQYTKTSDGVTKVDFDTDYSTDETIVGRWIDGKPIYQKTFTKTISGITDGTISTIDISTITNCGVSVNCYGYCYGIFVPYSNNSRFARFLMNSGTLQFQTNSNSFNTRTLYVTLQYTKTTD